LGSSRLGDEPFELAEQRVLKAAGIDNFYDWDGTLTVGNQKLTGSEALRELKQRAIADLKSQNLGDSIQLTKRESYWPGLYPPAATEKVGSTKPIQMADDNLAPKGLQIGSPTSISTRSNRIPAVALDLDKTIFKVTPEMQAAEDKALKFLKMNPEANLSLRAEAWGDWEKLAVKNLEANKEMLGFVKQLQDSGISMNVMTARSARVQEKTLGLLGKMDFIPDEVFFRPYTLEGEMEAAEKMKVGWIKKTSDKFDYISIFDDSQKTVTAALKAGVPSALQPSAGAIDRKFLQGSLERGLETMQATFSQDPDQLTRGISELENLIDMGAKKTTGRMLGAASEASAAVAGGIQKSGILRNAAAAATILGKRI